MAIWTTSNISPQTGKLAVVTGGNSGIGWHTALELARAGAEVILAARTEPKGRDAVERIRRELPQADVRFELLDLASLRSVRAFAARVAGEPKLDLLVNNAGVMAVPQRELTGDGFERQFGTNFLGPFALTALLMPALARSASPRITTVSSGAANMGLKRINFEDPQWAKSYSPWKAYCQSKLADLLFALELGRRYPSVLSDAAHPGYARTNLQTSGPSKTQARFFTILAPFMSQDAAHGALPTLRAATALDAVSGNYYAPSRLFQMKGDPVLVTVPPPAQDAAAARRLWDLSEELTSVEWPSVTGRSRSSMPVTQA